MFVDATDKIHQKHLLKNDLERPCSQTGGKQTASIFHWEVHVASRVTPSAPLYIAAGVII
jgi:hypothetical protein